MGNDSIKRKSELGIMDTIEKGIMTTNLKSEIIDIKRKSELGIIDTIETGIIDTNLA